jgi:hypothetical protein
MKKNIASEYIGYKHLYDKMKMKKCQKRMDLKQQYGIIITIYRLLMRQFIKQKNA